MTIYCIVDGSNTIITVFGGQQLPPLQAGYSELPSSDPRVIAYFAAQAAPKIPQHVTSAQALSALSNAGLLVSAQAIVDASASPLVKIAWERTNTFDRNSPTLAAISGALGLTSAQVDALFIAAALINP